MFFFDEPNRIQRTVPRIGGALLAISGLAGAASIEEALERVNAQCPGEYPEVVTALSEEREFAAMGAGELMRMLGNWNPALRAAASGELGRRGDAVVPQLRAATLAGEGTVRAGAATALAAIVDGDHADAGDVAGDFIRLAKDPELAVRVAALEGLSKLASPTPEATRAVLALCNDEDDYLAQGAMIALEKRFPVEALEHGKVMAALKEAMGSPLPRGKGHVLRLVKRMGGKAQREFIPLMLEHLDWQPRRDTMFGAGGQEDALVMLTELGVKEVVPRLPALMSKSMRGPGLFDPCLRSIRVFGKEARVLLPELREMIRAFESDPGDAGLWAARDGEKRVAALKETVGFLEGL